MHQQFCLVVWARRGLPRKIDWRRVEIVFFGGSVSALEHGQCHSRVFEGVPNAAVWVDRLCVHEIETPAQHRIKEIETLGHARPMRGKKTESDKKQTHTSLALNFVFY